MILEALRNEMDSMPAIYATIIDLFYVNECSHAEISKITGMPIGTIKTRLSRGRAMLKQSLEQKLPELKGGLHE